MVARRAATIREALSAEPVDVVAAGEVEIDGAYFGGHIRPENRKEDRPDRRLARNQNGKRQVVMVMVMRERGGRALPFVVRSEAVGAEVVVRRVAPGSTSTPTRRLAMTACTPAF